ncbi:MAG: hypothetical protein F6K30_22905 [Cyanothece sp. SIO2G6]|nr:hypothetical protein [Cyanothece sp. SIO2G6]
MTDPDNGSTTYTYDDGNNLVRTNFPNDTAEIREYDDLNRLTSLKTVRVDPVTGTETVLSSFDYTLNDAGHRLQVTEANGRVVNYTYDSLYRLTQESINNGERVFEYTYDEVGNRLTKSDTHNGSTALTTYTYDSHDRLQTEVLTQDGTEVHTIEYDYDPNGNLIRRTQTTAGGNTEATRYTWNDDDRLVKVETPTNVVEYEYDTEGIRVSSTVDGVTTDYLIDKNQPYAQVLEEFRSGDLETFYVYGHDLISQERNGEQDVYHVDGLGSTRGLTDEDGNVTDTYDYEAFGELIESSGDSENSYRFAGEQFDEDLGDYYLRDRFYDQGSGRFLRRDVYEGRHQEPLTLHKYLYAHGNPSNNIDPTGFFTVAEINAANSVRDILAGMQVDSGSHLINAILARGDYGVDNFLTDFAINAAFISVGFAASYLSQNLTRIPVPAGGMVVGGSLDNIGSGFGILTGRSVKVSKKGLEIVEAHLKRFDDVPQNKMMLERLQSAHAANRPISQADAVFYTHEIAEAGFMSRGMDYYDAHNAALAKYGVDPRSVYAPEVIQAVPEYFNSYWKSFWGLN